MATKQEMIDLLFKRFSKVPNVTSADCETWIDAALLTEGYTADNLPQERLALIMILAQAEGAMDIAMSAAHFFSYTDGDEVIDKSRIATEWRQIEKELRDKYEKERSRLAVTVGSTVKFRTARRLDRDK